MAACGDENGIPPPSPFLSLNKISEIAAILSQKTALRVNWGVKIKPAVHPEPAIIMLQHDACNTSSYRAVPTAAVTVRTQNTSMAYRLSFDPFATNFTCMELR